MTLSSWETRVEPPWKTRKRKSTVADGGLLEPSMSAGQDRGRGERERERENNDHHKYYLHDILNVPQGIETSK